MQPKLHNYKQKYNDGYKSVTSKDTRPCDTWKLVPQDPNDEPASVLLERIKAEKERLIKEGKIKRSKKSAKSSDTPHYENVLPDGWCLTDIGELLINRDGERKPVSSVIRSKQTSKIYDYYGAAGVIDKVDSYLLMKDCFL